MSISIGRMTWLSRMKAAHRVAARPRKARRRIPHPVSARRPGDPRRGPRVQRLRAHPKRPRARVSRASRAPKLSPVPQRAGSRVPGHAPSRARSRLPSAALEGARARRPRRAGARRPRPRLRRASPLGRPPPRGPVRRLQIVCRGCSTARHRTRMAAARRTWFVPRSTRRRSRWPASPSALPGASSSAGRHSSATAKRSACPSRRRAAGWTCAGLGSRSERPGGSSPSSLRKSTPCARRPSKSGARSVSP